MGGPTAGTVTAGIGTERIARRTLLAGLAGTAAIAVASRPGSALADSGAHAGHGSAAAAPVQRAGAGGTVREITLYAVAGPGTELAFGTSPDNATVPGPTIEAIEGDELRVTLVNTTTVPVSLHAHGLDVPAAHDGTAASGSVVPPGGQHTYLWGTHAPTQRADGSWEPGSAGYWHYHDHAVGSAHGTAGQSRGLFGAIVVRRTGDPLPDVQNIVVFNEVLINNQPAGTSVNYTANLGQRVEWVVLTYGAFGTASFHTFHLHAHHWADNRAGLLSGPDDVSRVIDNRTSGPGEAFGFQVVAGEHVGPAHWMYHCHVQFHADAGMVGLFIVNNADGTPPPGHHEHLQKHDAMLKDMAASGHAHGAGH
jgi:FtsP/CotA-like multicopper oxidase with cupredoxin domain